MAENLNSPKEASRRLERGIGGEERDARDKDLLSLKRWRRVVMQIMDKNYSKINLITPALMCR